MSSAERFVRHHKRQTDRAISQAYARLATDSRACATFTELLHGVRTRSLRLLAAPVIGDRHRGIDALLNLARFRMAQVRPFADWLGSEASWRGAVSSLAQHFVATHAVPRFLAAAWYADDEYAERKRKWFITHAAGASFRSLDVPIRMTSRMEHIFLSSPDDLGIEYAMRRAELVGLGAPQELVHAVLKTRLATDMRHGDFWRTVWQFLIANARSLEPTQVGPIIDFVHAIRHERVAVETSQGIVMRPPPQPSFSVQGRTVRSILRLVDEWHRSLGVANGGLTWTPSPLRPLLVEEPNEDPLAPPAVWHLMELTNGAQLRTEGTALRHCVASYADRCWRGRSRIWSLRVRRGVKMRHVLTIEVDLSKRAVVQARGWGNRSASGKPLRLLQGWAVRERLRLAI